MLSTLNLKEFSRYTGGSHFSHQDFFVCLFLFTAQTTSPKTTEHPETTKGVVLYVRLTLVVLVIVSSLSVLVFCRKRTCKAKSEEPEPPVETQHDFVTETDREYDDIGEADRSRSRPVEISSVHTHARYTRPNADETDDYYNIDTASNS
ncbi:hypothetical protein CesoFtcFv8_011836 [Champsocephalus esox]|uniref:Uncharacterized protein n=1 Tax=Champsocephalus esox TaxID=159716 RepID=A0AAN8GY48_9TELE|nr:hypothetical protein CesoFtcFv8_011835 [Champsocephalus esox]KAK5895223.1 hypothetical protein CesoFtcFv8_011836 [Champsocephalus esox]